MKYSETNVHRCPYAPEGVTEEKLLIIVQQALPFRSKPSRKNNPYFYSNLKIVPLFIISGCFFRLLFIHPVFPLRLASSNQACSCTATHSLDFSTQSDPLISCMGEEILLIVVPIKDCGLTVSPHEIKAIVGAYATKKEEKKRIAQGQTYP
jgi:hypothetical protein